MKTTVFITVLVFCFTLAIQAQEYEYVPLVNEEHVWSYCDVLRVGFDKYDLNYYHFQIKGDTIIHDISYKKVYKDYNNCSANPANYEAAIREENKRVYVVRSGEQHERLIYDFNMEVGDSIGIDTYHDYKVSKIDTVEIAGKLRKCYNCFYSSYGIIEGIGNLDGNFFLYPFDPILLYEVGICFNYQKNGTELVYKTDEWYFNENECQTADLLDSKNTWSVLMYEGHYYEPGLPPPGVTVYLSTWYKVGEDSIKEGKVYKQILKSQDINQEQWEFDCLMRKEGDKIYRDEPGRKAEYLLYDFGMNIGDTIVEQRSDNRDYPIASVLESIRDTVIGGTSRKLYSFVRFPVYDPDWTGTETWIEGIGSLRGLYRQSLDFLTGSDAVWSLLCFSHGNELVYHDPAYDECYYNTFDNLIKKDYTYIPYVEEGKRWSHAFLVQVSSAGDLKAEYSSCQLKGDTVINGLNYKKLLYGCSGTYIAALREENKKVFIKEDQHDERLFYDFNLQEGDRMTGYSINEHQVIKIDTVQIGDTQRKRFAFGEGTWIFETWIEGIGALEDFFPLQGRALGYAGQGINYQKKGTELVYKTDEWYFNENECPPNAIRPPLSSTDCVIQLNKEEITVRFFTKETVQISLSDMSGRLYYRSSFSSTTDATIPSFSFPKGIYLLKIVYPDRNRVNIHKILIRE